MSLLGCPTLLGGHVLTSAATTDFRTPFAAPRLLLLTPQVGHPARLEGYTRDRWALSAGQGCEPRRQGPAPPSLRSPWHTVCAADPRVVSWGLLLRARVARGRSG